MRLGLLPYLFVFAFFVNSMAYCQNKIDVKSLFESITKEAPQKLNIEELKSYPKFRNIHHDSFDRLKEIPKDIVTGDYLPYYSLADITNIGKNSYQNKNTYQYHLITINNADFTVGVKEQSGGYIAFNQIKGNKHNVKLLTIDAGVENYGLMVKKGTSKNADAKIVFYYLNDNNYYYVRLTDSRLLVNRVKNGRHIVVKRIKTSGENLMYILLQDGYINLFLDWKYVGNRKIKSDYSSICGLMFRGNEYSEVDDFVVERLDDWIDNGIDPMIETGFIKSGQFGPWQTEEGLITTSKRHTNESDFSLRFELNYYKDWEAHKIAGKRRTEIYLQPKVCAPLDSWISSFDIYFPGIGDGNEYYKRDGLDELFWQSHDSNAGPGLSPHLALYIKNDLIWFQTLSRSLLRYDNQGILSSSKKYMENGTIGYLVDTISSTVNGLEIMKGEWHNFTIYVREGYTEAQLPRTIVYVDGNKVIDWFHPNAYNCGQNAEYLKIGIYKWPWADSSLNPDVRKRVLYYDNILYLR